MRFNADIKLNKNKWQYTISLIFLIYIDSINSLVVKKWTKQLAFKKSPQHFSAYIEFYYCGDKLI